MNKFEYAKTEKDGIFNLFFRTSDSESLSNTVITSFCEKNEDNAQQVINALNMILELNNIQSC